jgi:serine O-acetyltransferase
MRRYDGDMVKAWAGESQFRAWRADFKRFRKHGYSGWFSEGFWALSLYRLRHTMLAMRPKFLWWLPLTILLMINKFFTMVTHISLHPHAKIGPGTLIPHVGPVYVSPWATIGADCAIHQVCTIGAGAKPGGAVIGDHVFIGCHTCILGPVRVGDRAKIGAGAVVVTDIPAGATAVGVPAKVVRMHEEILV